MYLEFRQGDLEDVSQLRALWKEAFGDSDAYLDIFWDTAFSCRRCRVATSENQIVGALYWFSCALRGQSLAYIYAVATKAAHRGQGIATALMADTHRYLESRNFAGTILVPATRALVLFYAKMGYRPCAPQGRLKAAAAGPAVHLSAVSPRRYGELRKALLPAGGVEQTGVSLDFLATQTHLYAGKELLLAATVTESGSLLAQELLCREPIRSAPGILKALRVQEGIFRLPYSKGRPFALFRPFTGWKGTPPEYFAFAFD